MRCLRLDLISVLCLEVIKLLAVIMLLASSAQAFPESNHSWTEIPWKSSEEQPLEGLVEKAAVLSMPLAFNLSGNEPASLQIGSHFLNFSEYAPSPFSCQLWMRKDVQWSRYLKAYQGEDVDIILYMPEYGNVDFYLISYANGSQNHWSFKLLEGYHLLRLTAEVEGRYFIIAMTGNEPGNALILDLVSRPIIASISPLDVGTISIGKAMVTVKSQRMRGYDVYLDGVFYSSDIGDGSIDGIAIFTVGADKTHTIAVFQRDIQGNIVNKSEHTKSFKRDVAYTLLIE